MNFNKMSTKELKALLKKILKDYKLGNNDLSADEVLKKYGLNSYDEYSYLLLFLETLAEGNTKDLEASDIDYYFNLKHKLEELDKIIERFNNSAI